MKDLQRCWSQGGARQRRPGARILEIGAGEPLVAGLLSRLGYEVTVVDPYDGSDNGPRELREFRRLYPDLEFVRDHFPPEAGLEPRFAAIYSVSVLEHVPLDAIDAVIGSDATELARRAGRLLDPRRRPRARRLGGGCPPRAPASDRRRLGPAAAGLRERIAALETDPRPTWSPPRPTTAGAAPSPTTQYPMRRIASVQLFKRLSDPPAGDA